MRFISSAVIPIVGFLFLLAAPATAAHWKISQITDNDGSDVVPKVISQGWVTWTYRLLLADEEIMLYFPGASPVRQVTDNDYADLYPDISWDVASEKVTLCWQGRCGSDNTFEIFTLGSKAPLRLTNNAFDDTNPKIWGTHIVWNGQHNLADWEIFRYTPALGVVQLTKDSLDDYPPVVSGSRILWSKADPEGDYGQETYTFDGFDIIRLTENAWMENDHQIDGSHLVWGMFHGSGTAGNWEIHHKRADGPVEQLTDNGLANLDPVVSGNRIAWTMYDGNDKEIMYFDGSTIRQLTHNAYDDVSVRMSGPRILWISEGTSPLPTDDTLLLFDDTDGSLTTLDQGRPISNPDIGGDFVVWQAFDGHDIEIMMAVACEKLAGDVNDDCVVDLADFAALAADWLDCTLPSAYCP